VQQQLELVVRVEHIQSLVDQVLLAYLLAQQTILADLVVHSHGQQVQVVQQLVQLVEITQVETVVL
jgi:hypothetical protein